jgi:hapalindole-type alkaloid chlorinase
MSVHKTFKSIINLFSKRDDNGSLSFQQQSSKGKKRTDMWDFPTLSMSDILKKEAAITDLYDNKTNGYLIKGFMSHEEVEYALANLNNLNTTANGEFPRGAGHSNPKTFSMLADEEKGINEELLERYFKEIEQYRMALNSILPFGYEERLLKFFSSIESNIEVKVPIIKNGQEFKKLTTSTIRFCYPDGGGMNTHVGNMFPTIYPLFYSFLNKLMNIERQISYFVMLSKPETGGDLVLFDALWGDFILYDTTTKSIVRSDGERVSLTDLDYQPVSPEPGDMILFNGGDIWHKVDNLLGTKSRITIGGFLAKTRDSTNVYVWS